MPFKKEQEEKRNAELGTEKANEPFLSYICKYTCK